MFSFAVSILTFALISAPTRAEQNGLSSVREVILPNFQSQVLGQDLPAKSIFIENGKPLWIAGRQAIWRWNLDSNRLQKIQIIKKDNPDEVLQHIKIFDQKIFVTSNHNLYIVSFDPLAIRTIPSKETPSLRLEKGDDSLVWFNTQAAHLIDQNFQEPRLLGMMPSLKPTNPLVFDSLNSRIWFAEGSRLNQINFEDQKPIVKKIAEAKHHLKSIHIVKDGIFAHTQHTILRYSLAGELVQTIPVEGKNKLLNMHLNQSQHSYLFASGLLEVYRIEDQSVHRFKLPFDQTEALEAMVTDGSYFVALVEGKPRAFQLESAP